MNSSQTHKAKFWYLLGVPFNVSDDHPRHFYMGVPPGFYTSIIISYPRMTASTICFAESPHFTTKLSPSVTFKENQNVTLRCEAAGFPPPVIAWSKNGHAIKEERKRQFKKRNFEIMGIQFEDRGIYTCTAENLLGRVQLSVNVTVNGMY